MNKKSRPMGRGVFKRKEIKMITRSAKGYMVRSMKGRNLGGPYKTKEEAKKRLRQVEFFKHQRN